MAHILIVEDEAHIAQMIGATLALGGYTSETCADGQKAVERIFSGGFDLILLDVMLPGLDGFSVMERVAELDVPVIFLSAMQQVADKVKGLHLGAEDYIAKPFEALELLARVEVALRRRGRGAQVLQYGDIRQDLAAHTVTRGGRPVTLSPKEFELLRVFLQNQDLALSREKLLAMVWGYEFEGETRTVDVHVRTLRQKLGSCGGIVETVRGVGYKIDWKG